MTIVSRSAAVKLDSVTKSFGNTVAVDNITLDIEAGTLVTLLGPSGCGKTTTLRMIAGLEMQTSGHVLIGGKDVTLLPPNERDVSMVFQSYALFPHMSVIDNVSYGLRQSQLSRQKQRDKAREGLKMVGLEGYDDRLPSELSGGQQQRVAVARALVLEPQVLLFDEPLSNLDAKLRRRMREEIRDLQQALGLTCVYVTHDQEEALAVSDKIVVMNGGMIAQVGTPHDLYERPVDAFVADFIGSANLIPGSITSRDREKKLVSIDLGNLRINVPDRDYDGSNVYLVVRPNGVSLDSQASKAPSLPAKVKKATYLGSHWEYTISAANCSMFVIQPTHKVFSPGSSVFATLDPDHITVVRRV
jgi:iron(III) transport system ATP-binding protein